MASGPSIRNHWHLQALIHLYLIPIYSLLWPQQSGLLLCTVLLDRIIQNLVTMLPFSQPCTCTRSLQILSWLC